MSGGEAALPRDAGGANRPDPYRARACLAVRALLQGDRSGLGRGAEGGCDDPRQRRRNVMPPIARPWFRMYSDLLDNLKVEKLSDKQYRRWSKLLALANVNIPRGRLPPVDKIAFRLRVNEAAATLTVQEFIDLKFIDVIRGAWVMHDWDDWQKDSDARTTEGRSIRGASAADTRRNEQPIANDKPLMRRLEGEGEGEGDKEREEEEEKDHGTVPVVRAFERCFGRLLSPMEIENIKALDEEHPRDRIDYALRETAALGKRSVRYVQRVCETQAQAGDN